MRKKVEGGQKEGRERGKKGAKIPAGSWSQRVHSCSQLCNESQRLQQTLHQVGIKIPRHHCRPFLLLPVTPVWMHQPPHHHMGPLIALRLQEGRARWRGTGHGTPRALRRKRDGAGRTACTRTEGHGDFSFLNRETGYCSPPKNASLVQRLLIPELLQTEQRGETSSAVPGPSAFPPPDDSTLSDPQEGLK